jgi:peptidoglycan/LPS O-acetylase OafA/YrhL
MGTGSAGSRVYGLDIMRAAAIGFVMLSHSFAYLGGFSEARDLRWLVLDGVGLFFVLSGFLIGGILISQTESGNFGGRQLAGFWMRRWLRTLPAYFVVLTFLIGCYYIRHSGLPPGWGEYYFFLQNFNSPHPLFFAEAWSLSVEEWFYVLVPLCLLSLTGTRIQKRWVAMFVIASVLVAVTSLRLYRVSQEDYIVSGRFGSDILKVVVTRMDAIMFGVLGAWVSYYFPGPFSAYRKPLLVTGLLILVACNLAGSPYFLTRWHYSLAPVGALFLLPALSSIVTGRGVTYRVVTFISVISYSMYLTNHMIVQRGLMPFITRWLGLNPAGSPLHSLLALLLFWGLTIGAAFILYRLVEKPFMALRERLETGRASRGSLEPAANS